MFKLQTSVLVGMTMLCPQILLAQKDFLIVANGEWDTSVITRHMPGKITIALDGATKKFHTHAADLGFLKPDYILGDFDSIHEESLESNYFNVKAAMAYYNEQSVPNDAMVEFEPFQTEVETESGFETFTYLRAASQNYTDLEKGLLFCFSQREDSEPVSITIAGAFGGERMDHLLNNFSVLAKDAFRRDNVTIKMINSLQAVQFLQDESVEFEADLGGHFGLFGFPLATAWTEGLEWELDGFKLNICGDNSFCNVLKSNKVSVRVEGSAIMMSPLPSIEALTSRALSTLNPSPALSKALEDGPEVA